MILEAPLLQQNIAEVINTVNDLMYQLHGEEPVPRVVGEIIRATTLAILNNQTYSIFNPISDNWTMDVKEIMTMGQFDYPHWKLKKPFDDMVNQISTICMQLTQQFDKRFSIWETDVLVECELLRIIYQGDYRIEQWSQQNGVPATRLGNNLTADLTSFINLVKKKVNYGHQPARSFNVSKVDRLDRLVRHLLNYFIFGNNTAFYECVSIIDGYRLELNADVIIDELGTVFEMDYNREINRQTQGRGISSFIIEGSVLTVSTTQYKSSTLDIDFRKLELAQHERNGDFVPASMRR